MLCTQNALFTINGATSSCLAASSVHFTLSDLDFKRTSREKSYWTAKATYSKLKTHNTDSIWNYIATSKIAFTRKVICVCGVHFKPYLDNWMTNRFKIHSVARSKVAIMILGLNSIISKCGMCLVFAQQVTYSKFH